MTQILDGRRPTRKQTVRPDRECRDNGRKVGIPESEGGRWRGPVLLHKRRLPTALGQELPTALWFPINMGRYRGLVESLGRLLLGRLSRCR